MDDCSGKKQDTKFFYLFKRLLEKIRKYITNKFPYKLSEDKITKTESVPENCKLKIFESKSILTANKIPQNLSLTIEIKNISSEYKIKTGKSKITD